MDSRNSNNSTKYILSSNQVTSEYLKKVAERELQSTKEELLASVEKTNSTFSQTTNIDQYTEEIIHCTLESVQHTLLNRVNRGLINLPTPIDKMILKTVLYTKINSCYYLSCLAVNSLNTDDLKKVASAIAVEAAYDLVCGAALSEVAKVSPKAANTAFLVIIATDMIGAIAAPLRDKTVAYVQKMRDENKNNFVFSNRFTETQRVALMHDDSLDAMEQEICGFVPAIAFHQLRVKGTDLILKTLSSFSDGLKNKLNNFVNYPTYVLPNKINLSDNNAAKNPTPTEIPYYQPGNASLPHLNLEEKYKENVTRYSKLTDKNFSLLAPAPSCMPQINVNTTSSIILDKKYDFQSGPRTIINPYQKRHKEAKITFNLDIFGSTSTAMGVIVGASIPTTGGASAIVFLGATVVFAAWESYSHYREEKQNRRFILAEENTHKDLYGSVNRETDKPEPGMYDYYGKAIENYHELKDIHDPTAFSTKAHKVFQDISYTLTTTLRGKRESLYKRKEHLSKKEYEEVLAIYNNMENDFSKILINLEINMASKDGLLSLRQRYTNQVELETIIKRYSFYCYRDAAIAWQQGNLKEAVTNCTEALKYDASNTDIANALAAFYENASRESLRDLYLTTTDAQILDEIKAAYLNKCCSDAYQAFENGEAELIISYCEEGLAVDATNVKLKECQASLLLKLILQDWKENSKYIDRVILLEESLGKSPLLLYLVKGDIATNEGNFEQAYEYGKKALQTSPEKFESVRLFIESADKLDLKDAILTASAKYKDLSANNAEQTGFWLFYEGKHSENSETLCQAFELLKDTKDYHYLHLLINCSQTIKALPLTTDDFWLNKKNEITKETIATCLNMLADERKKSTANSSKSKEGTETSTNSEILDYIEGCLFSYVENARHERADHEIERIKEDLYAVNSTALELDIVDDFISYYLDHQNTPDFLKKYQPEYKLGYSVINNAVSIYIESQQTLLNSINSKSTVEAVIASLPNNHHKRQLKEIYKEKNISTINGISYQDNSQIYYHIGRMFEGLLIYVNTRLHQKKQEKLDALQSQLSIEKNANKINEISLKIKQLGSNDDRSWPEYFSNTLVTFTSFALDSYATYQSTTSTITTFSNKSAIDLIDVPLLVHDFIFRLPLLSKHVLCRLPSLHPAFDNKASVFIACYSRKLNESRVNKYGTTHKLTLAEKTSRFAAKLISNPALSILSNVAFVGELIRWLQIAYYIYLAYISFKELDAEYIKLKIANLQKEMEEISQGKKIAVDPAKKISFIFAEMATLAAQISNKEMYIQAIFYKHSCLNQMKMKPANNIYRAMAIYLECDVKQLKREIESSMGISQLISEEDRNEVVKRLQLKLNRPVVIFCTKNGLRLNLQPGISFQNPIFIAYDKKEDVFASIDIPEAYLIKSKIKQVKAQTKCIQKNTNAMKRSMAHGERDFQNLLAEQAMLVKIQASATSNIDLEKIEEESKRSDERQRKLESKITFVGLQQRPDSNRFYQEQQSPDYDTLEQSNDVREQALMTRFMTVNKKN